VGSSVLVMGGMDGFIDKLGRDDDYT